MVKRGSGDAMVFDDVMRGRDLKNYNYRPELVIRIRQGMVRDIRAV